MRLQSLLALFGSIACVSGTPSELETDPSPPTASVDFDVELIERARTAAKMIPGERPLEVRFQGLAEWNDALSSYIDGTGDKEVPWVIGVFQIVYRSGWIMVDAGASQDYLGEGYNFIDEGYSRLGSALMDADMTVLTHEHGDHVQAVFGEDMISARQRTLITEEQLQSFLVPVSGRGGVLQMSEAETDGALIIGYNDVLPIAPGAVLIKAPGHTPGSQMVFLELSAGTEVLLVGDVIWHRSQIDLGTQKSSVDTAWLGEDRDALAHQISWLQEMDRAGLHLVIAHDQIDLASQIDRSILKDGLYIPSSSHR